MSKKSLYTLSTWSGEVLCVCTSKKQLKNAVDYWMNERPLTTITCLEWEPNYFPEPLTWEWAYISPSAKYNQLSAGGGFVPPKKYWGDNLIGIDFSTHFNEWVESL